jgi:hypothetical protein
MMEPRHLLAILGFVVAVMGRLDAAPFPSRPLEFSAEADGRALELHEFRQGKFALFEAAGPFDVDIRTGFEIRWVNVRPRSAGAVAAIGSDHHSVRFHSPGAFPLTVEFNDDLSRVVHLFAYSPETTRPDPTNAKVHYFGPGMHKAGLIELKDGETLYLAAGSWVTGSVRSVGTRNVTVCGHGVLDGSDVGGPTGTPFRNLIYLDRTIGARIEGITIFNCDRPRTADVFGTVFITRSTGTRVDGVHILNPSENYGDDGFDIVSSSHVKLENIFVRTNDDCVAIKNLADVDTHDITVRHAVIWDMPSGGNGLEIGFEIRGHPVRDIHFQDIDIIHVERGAALSIHNGDTGPVENVSYDDIRVEDVRRKLIDFAVLYSQGGVDRPADDAENSRRLDVGGAWDGLLTYTPAERAERARFRGSIRGIRVTNLRVIEGALPYSVIAGFDEAHQVDDVVFEGLEYQGRLIRDAVAGKFVIEHASGVVFK